MKNVMIVEDQKMIRTLLEGYIRQEPGYRVTVSLAGAAQAPDLCCGIDLVLMDVQTEHRENGLTAARLIHQRYPAVKIVVVTSLVDFAVLEQARAVGAPACGIRTPPPPP